VFGTDLQKPEWEIVLVFEGIFDAISMNGLALTHNTINDNQVAVIQQLGKRVIVVPDQDKTGLEICDRALELGFEVSLPNWSEDIKDANDAIIKYGRLNTLLSIIDSATNSKIKVEVMRNKIVKRI
jgi:DNA primase